MPRRKKRTYRRKPRRRKTYRKRKPKLYMPIGGFSKRKLVKLRYVRQSNLDGNANGYAVQSFLANGLNYIFQPQSGSIPVDRASNFLRNMDSYERYTVLGSKIKSTFITDGTANVVPSYCGIYLARSQNDIATVLTNGITKLFEQPRNVRFRRVFGPSQSSNGMTLTMNWSASKFFQKSKSNIRDEPEYAGTASEDPTDPYLGYFQIFSHNVNGNNPGKVTVITQIDYIVQLSQTALVGN